MAGLRLVPRRLTTIVFGLCAATIGWIAEPARAQYAYETPSMYPEYPPTYRNSGNAITRDPVGGGVSFDLTRSKAVDPLANNEPARNREYRAAERSAATRSQGPSLSESFNPALRPAEQQPLATTSAAAPAPGSTRSPTSSPPRASYPTLSPPPSQVPNQGGLPPVQPIGGPLAAPGRAGAIEQPNLPMQPNAPLNAGPSARMARDPSPLGPPQPPTSANPDLVGAVVPTGPMVMDVRVEGNEAISPDRIRPHVKCRKGRPLDKLQVEEDVKRLLATRLFTAVRPKYVPVPGGITVLFQVIERPTLKYVKYQGSHLRTKTLAKQTGLKKGDAADPFAVEEARIKLEQFFRDRGHNKVRVTVAEGSEPGDKGAVFMIHEGPIPRVNKIKFINNTIATDARLKTQIASKKPWFRIPGVWGGWKGYAQPETINADVDTLTDYYRGLGFFSARISREVELNDSQEWADITFVINQGPRYSLRTVSFIGQSKFSEDELKEKLSLKPGEFFDRSKMRKDVSAIEEKYGAKGYVFADIEAAPRFFEEPGQLDLVFRVSEGRRYRVGQINVHIQGENPHTRRLAVLNRLSIRPGDIMDIRKIRDSERRLQASGIFLYKPQEGEEPKITFSPPSTDDTEQLVENPDATNRGVRGQSPDPLIGRYRAMKPVAGEEPEVIINIGFTDCQVLDEQPGAALRGTQQAPVAESGTSLPEESETMLDARWDDSRVRPRAVPQAPTAKPTRTTLPPGTIIRGQSPDDQAYPTRQNNELNWRQPQSTNRPAQSAIAGRPAPRPQIVRGQGDTGYQPMSGEMMPSFSVDRQLGRSQAPVRGMPVQQSFQPNTSYPQPSRPVVSPNGLPVGSTYQPPTGGNVAPPGGFAPVAQAPPAQVPSTNTYGQFVPAAPGPAVGNAPTWMSPNVPPPAPNASPVVSGPVQAPVAGVPPAGAQPGVLPPPDGYDSPEQIFGGPGDRNWIEEDPALPIDVIVKETQTGRLMLGVGVNSNAGLVGSAVIDEQNFDITRFPRSWSDVMSGTAFRGAGQHFRVEAMPGTQFQRYLISFSEPYLFDTPVLFGINGSYFVRQYPNWTEQRLGGRVNLGYQLAPDLTVGAALRAESINISNPTVPTPQQLLDVLGNNALYTGRVNIVQDTRDSAFLPTQGRRISAAFEQGFGDFSYPRGEFEATQYFTLRQRPDGSGRHVLRLGGQFGISGSDTPIFENFFAGGYSSIRGFRFRGASPVDMGVIVGGRLMLLAGAEYMFPITADDMLRGVVFCDTGTVEQDITINGDDYRVAVGAGFRITVPMMGPAPIALDFAVPLARADTDQSQVLSFFVGVQY